MQLLLILLILFVLLEIASLVVLFLAFRWLSGRTAYFAGVTSAIPKIRTAILGEIRSGRAAVLLLPTLFNYIGKRLPLWIRLPLQLFGWFAQVKR